MSCTAPSVPSLRDVCFSAPAFALRFARASFSKSSKNFCPAGDEKYDSTLFFVGVFCCGVVVVAVAVFFPAVIAADGLVRLSDAPSFSIFSGEVAVGDSDPETEACCAFDLGKNSELQRRDDVGGDGRELGAGGPAFVIPPPPAVANPDCNDSPVYGDAVFFLDFNAVGVDECCRAA